MDTIGNQSEAINEGWKSLQRDMLAFMGSHTVELSNNQRLEEMAEFLTDPVYSKTFQDLSNRSLDLAKKCQSQIMKHLDAAKTPAPPPPPPKTEETKPHAHPKIDANAFKKAGKNLKAAKSKEEVSSKKATGGIGFIFNKIQQFKETDTSDSQDEESSFDEEETPNEQTSTNHNDSGPKEDPKYEERKWTEAEIKEAKAKKAKQNQKFDIANALKAQRRGFVEEDEDEDDEDYWSDDSSTDETTTANIGKTPAPGVQDKAVQEKLQRLAREYQDQPTLISQESQGILEAVRSNVVAFWSGYQKKSQDKINQYNTLKHGIIKLHEIQDKDARKKRLEEIKIKKAENLANYISILDKKSKAQKSAEAALLDLKNDFLKHDKIDIEAFKKASEAILTTLKKDIEIIKTETEKEKERIDKSLALQAKSQDEEEQKLEDNHNEAVKLSKMTPLEQQFYKKEQKKNRRNLERSQSARQPKIKPEPTPKAPVSTQENQPGVKNTTPKPAPKAKNTTNRKPMPRSESVRDFATKTKTKGAQKPASDSSTKKRPSIAERMKIFGGKPKNTPLKRSAPRHQAPKTPIVDPPANVPAQKKSPQPKKGFVDNLINKFNK